MPVEVGARGLVGKSAYTFLTQIGLSSRERTKTMTKMSEVAEARLDLGDERPLSVAKKGENAVRLLKRWRAFAK